MADMKQFVANTVESELRFIWQDKEVELEAQYLLTNARLTAISRFSEIEDEKEAFKNTISGICRLDLSTIGHQIVMSDIASAWTAARTLGQAEMDKNAATVASGSTIPDTLPNRPFSGDG